MSKTISIEVDVLTEVDIDVADIIGGISTEDLETELRTREVSNKSVDSEYDNLYYALRDGDLEAAIKIANPILYTKIGRMI